jgi:hypothetical protein
MQWLYRLQGKAILDDNCNFSLHFRLE